MYSVWLAICFYHFVSIIFRAPLSSTANCSSLVFQQDIWVPRIYLFFTQSLHIKGKSFRGGQKVVGKNIKDAEDCHHHKGHRFLLSIKEMVRNSAPPLELSVSPCTLFLLSLKVVPFLTFKESHLIAELTTLLKVIFYERRLLWHRSGIRIQTWTLNKQKVSMKPALVFEARASTHYLAK